MAMNIYRWLVLVLSAPLELLKAPTFQRRYKKIKEAYLQLTSTSSWNRHALNATSLTSAGQLGIGNSVERLGKYAPKIALVRIGLMSHNIISSQLDNASLITSFAHEDTSGFWYMKCSDVFSRTVASPLRWIPQRGVFHSDWVRVLTTATRVYLNSPDILAYSC